MKSRTLVIILTMLLITACAPVSTPSSQTPLSGPVKVNISGFAFDPANLTVKVGTTVTWTNQDSVVHNVKADDNSWGSNDLKTGDTYSYTFTKAGTYPYRCGFHPNMLATVTVVAQ